jgi:hypothetical protein
VISSLKVSTLIIIREYDIGETVLTIKPQFPTTTFPFLDEVFKNSPLCQICIYANYGIGGVCSLLLNRRMPNDLVIKGSQIVSCKAHRNWVEELDQTDDYD